MGRNVAFVNRRTLIRTGTIGVAGLSAAALVGCGGGAGKAPAKASNQGSGAAEQPKLGGTFRSYQTAPQLSMGSLDPHITTGVETWNLISDTPLRWSPDGSKLEGHLVDKWEIAPDGLTIKMHVRQGAKWHDKPPTNGRAVTADDVAFNYMRLAGKLNPERSAEFQRSSAKPNLVSAKPVDDQTFVITLSRPHSGFLGGDYRDWCVPRDYVEKASKLWDPNSLVGSGAWMVDRYDDNVKVVFKRNPNYWRGAPYMDAIEYSFFPDRATALAAFSTGAVDSFGNAVTAVEEKLLSAQPTARRVGWPQGQWQIFRFGVTRKPFDDPRVRKAIQLVFDYKKDGDARWGVDRWQFTGPLPPAFGGEGIPASEIAKLPGYNNATKEADIKTAKALMSAAGFSDGKITFKLAIGAVADDTSQRLYDAVKTTWPAMDLSYDVAADQAANIRRRSNNAFDIEPSNYWVFGDALLQMEAHLRSTGSRNFGKWTSAKFDTLADKAATQLDRKERAQTLREMQNLVLEEVPVVGVQSPNQAYYMKNYVKGVDPSLFSVLDSGWAPDIFSNKFWLDK